MDRQLSNTWIGLCITKAPPSVKAPDLHSVHKRQLLNLPLNVHKVKDSNCANISYTVGLRKLRLRCRTVSSASQFRVRILLDARHTHTPV